MIDGGPAFPTEANTQPGRFAHHGMTLRDWFAGQALAGICSNDFALNAYVPEQCAQWAYQFADAMLAERLKS